MTEENKVDRWNTVGAEDIPTTAFDTLVSRMLTEWDVYEAKLDEAKALKAVYDETEIELMDLLKRAKKTKYQAEGLGTVGITNKYMVKTPKSIEDKQSLFDWIKGKFGYESMMGLTTINSQTLNAFVNEIKEKEPTIEIPGLEAPTHRETLSFRAEKKK